jgi:hypothetical protein
MWLTASIWPVSVSDCGCLSDSHHEHRIVLHETRDLGDGRVFASGSMSLGGQPELGPFRALHRPDRLPAQFSPSALAGGARTTTLSGPGGTTDGSNGNRGYRPEERSRARKGGADAVSG